LSRHGCPILAVLSLLPCSGNLSCFLSWLYCPDCLLWLLCPHCSVLMVLSHLSCSSALLPQLTYPHSPVFSRLSWLTCRANLSRLSCRGCPVQHHSRCRVSDVMSPVYCYGGPASVFPSQLSCPTYPVPSVMFWISCPSSLSCPACTIPTVFSSCPGPAVLPRLSCPSYPAPAFLSTALLPPCPVFVLHALS
jgi:hypothetical protein